MALTHHPDLEYVAGDDWTISGVLLDVNGSPLDITNASFLWTLIDPNGETVDDLVNGAIISIVQPSVNGQVQIFVPSFYTYALLAGRFHDALRVYIGYTSTFWLGNILVDGNPFDLPPIDSSNSVIITSSVEDILAGAAALGKPTIEVS